MTPKPQKNKFRIPKLTVRLLLTFVCLLLFAKLVEKDILFPRFDERHAGRIQKIFTEKEQTLLRHIDVLEQCIQTPTRDSCFANFHEKYVTGLNKHGLFLFIYLNDTLCYWSTKDAVVPKTYSSSEFDKPYVSLGNNRFASGKYASFVRKQNNYAVVGLALIKDVHWDENKYLKTAFQKDFKLPANVKVFPEQVDDCYPITNSQGQFVWSLIFDSACFYQFQIHVPALLYLLAIIVFLLLLDSIFGLLRTTVARNLYLPALALILAGVRYSLQHWQIPKVFYELDIFKPVYFGSACFHLLASCTCGVFSSLSLLSNYIAF